MAQCCIPTNNRCHLTLSLRPMNWTVRTPPRKDIVSPAAEVSPRPQARYIPVLEDCRILKSALLSLAGTQRRFPVAYLARKASEMYLSKIRSRTTCLYWRGRHCRAACRPSPTVWLRGRRTGRWRGCWAQESYVDDGAYIVQRKGTNEHKTSYESGVHLLLCASACFTRISLSRALRSGMRVRSIPLKPSSIVSVN